MAGLDADIQALLLRLQELRAACEAAIQERKAADAQLNGLPQVTFIAASKRQPLHKLMALYDAGQHDFGENYVQELQEKSAAMQASGRRARWHFIGALQRNKVGAVLATRATVHTVDSLVLAQKLSRRAAALQQPTQVLLQVRDEASPPSRAGAEAENIDSLAQSVAALPGLQLRGLMVLPLADVDPRPAFTRLRALSLQLRGLPGCAQAHELSMGMSHDFRAAILEGATMVRVGSRLFGPRP